MSGRDQILSARTIEGMIAQGSLLVIFHEYVLRLDSWADKHPGGRLAILHMVGRDATDEITVYHFAATLKTMKAYRIGLKPKGPWTNMTPPIRGGVYRHPDVPAAAGAAGHTDNVASTLSPEKDTCADSLAADQGSADHTLADDSSVSTGCDHHDARSTPCFARKSAIGQDPVAAAALPPMLAGDPEKAAGLATELYDSRGACGDDEKAKLLPPGHPALRMNMSRDEYTDWAVEQEIQQGLQEYPSLDPRVQQSIVSRYRLLHEQVEKENLYVCRYIEYGKEMARYTTLFAIFLVALRAHWYITSAFFLGLFWHQIMFTAHDAGHRAITKSFVYDTLIGIFVADFCCGLSIGWWKRSHNVHHLITNHPEHDPDVQNIPLFATCPSFFRSLHSTFYNATFYWDAFADFLVPYQAYTYYPLMGLARFLLYLLSWGHVLSGNASELGGTSAWWVRWAEMTAMSCYWFLFGYLLVLKTLPDWYVRVAFVLVSHIVTMPLHVQITLSHWGMSTSELGESECFAQRQLRTTMDVDCPRWLDFVHGGLQFQAMHHLFPRVPRHNLRRVQELGRSFCEDTGIPYAIFTFVDGNRKVINRLGEVGDQVRILVQCQKYMAETGESGLH